MGVRGGVEWRQSETLFPGRAQDLYTHESPGLVTSRSLLTKGKLESSSAVGSGWELFALDEKFQVGTI